MNTCEGRPGGAPANYLSYLLRLWRTGEGRPWRGSLENAETGERLGFGDLDALVQFLREQMRASAPDRADRA